MSSTSNAIKVHFSSKKQNWETPDELFNKLNEEFHFDLDVAASDDNAKCDSYITEEQNGLTTPWAGTCWCNPPYKTSKDWIAKASTEAKLGVTTVILLPARTDTRAFHKYIYNQPNVEIRFLPGRIKFKGAAASAPFPSMLVIFRPGDKNE